MKIFKGKVVSTKMTKTATVAVERVVAHPVYKKRYKRVKKYQVHDEMGVDVGQIVRFVACKPYSKTKKWIIVDEKGNPVLETKKETKKPATKAKKTTKTASAKVAAGKKKGAK